MVTINQKSQVPEDLVKEKEVAFAEFIQRSGLKTTRQRNTIISTFFRLKGHISVEELLVEERRFGDGLARYEGHSEIEHHDHMICLECGVISEFYNPRLEALQEKLAEDNNFEIYRHRLELYGVCKDKAACNSRKQNKAAKAFGA